jgi:hypothetical protein
MTMYRKRLEEKARSMAARVSAAGGLGALLALENHGPAVSATEPLRIFASGRASMGAVEFLRRYRDGIAALPPLTGPALPYLEKISQEERIIFTTLLPSMSAIKRRFPELNISEAAQATRDYCVAALTKAIG